MIRRGAWYILHHYALDVFGTAYQYDFSPIAASFDDARLIFGGIPPVSFSTRCGFWFASRASSWNFRNTRAQGPKFQYRQGQDRNSTDLPA